MPSMELVMIPTVACGSGCSQMPTPSSGEQADECVGMLKGSFVSSHELCFLCSGKDY